MKDLYQKLENGDTLTDKELKELRDHLKKIANGLLQLGPKYSIATAELYRRVDQCESYLFHRGLSFLKVSYNSMSRKRTKM